MKMKGYHCKKCQYWFDLKIIWLCPVCGNDSITESKMRKQEEKQRLDAAWLVTWERHERGELKL